MPAKSSEAPVKMSSAKGYDDLLNERGEGSWHVYSVISGAAVNVKNVAKCAMKAMIGICVKENVGVVEKLKPSNMIGLDVNALDAKNA